MVKTLEPSIGNVYETNSKKEKKTRTYSAHQYHERSIYIHVREIIQNGGVHSPCVAAMFRCERAVVVLREHVQSISFTLTT